MSQLNSRRPGQTFATFRNSPRQAALNAIHCPDILALVGFHGQAMPMTTFVSAFDPSFARAVTSLPNVVGGNGTNLTAGLRAANDLLEKAPRGLIRRVWALSDGEDNHETDGLMAEVARARRQWTNINTIGFGAKFAEARLRAVAAGTHGGRYVSVATAQKLAEVFRGGGSGGRHRGEATVFCIDLSPSMTEFMGSARKIDIVRDTMLSLTLYKQRAWS